MLAYDSTRGTDLVGTLDTYFGCGTNLVRTREALHVHVNTVTQRLQRVAHLLGEDGSTRSGCWSCSWRCACTAWWETGVRRTYADTPRCR